MQYITENVVELSNEEYEAREAFEELLDAGYNIATSLFLLKKEKPDLHPAFYEWISK